MSELFMECEEEELEPWQKQVPQVNLVDDDDDDDDEPIFIGELTNSKQTPAPLQRRSEGRAAIQPPARVTRSSAPIMLPLTLPKKTLNTVNTVKTAPPAPSITTTTTITPRPVIVNNQGFIVTSPQLASLGKQYPPGTSFTLVPASQLQQVNPGALVPGVVHRPQVQQINNNIVTLSNVQSPAVYTATANQQQPPRSNPQPVQLFSMPAKAHNTRDQSLLKRPIAPQINDSPPKRIKFDLEPAKVVDLVENGTFRRKCPKCKEEFLHQDVMKRHMMSCCVNLVENVFPSPPNNTPAMTGSKRIMLVSDFYYGRFEGDRPKPQKTNTTFKCQSCLKVLKNNIRFMNHMKHHLELEKQNSESWESHTTCQHCYRQYNTPFQLQCHIESAHSPFESSTNCKICELAFESEQVLLEHMKDNHKPGEMPYVCQVCNFRSSFFTEVETHFRNVHENTKDLLCPFCLKVFRSSHTYMQHYMKHQKKGIQRCGKCRLNFLTYKEKLEHKTHVHKTFRKPKALEGLPPGTKVTIRASVTGKAPMFPNSPERSGYNVSPEAPHQAKATVSIFTTPNVPGAGKAKTAQTKKQERPNKNNLSLKDLRVDGGTYTCIECHAKVDDFFAHYSMLSKCSACKYRTSCRTSIGEHMIKFHSTTTRDWRFKRMRNRRHPATLKLTLVCLSCDLIVDASGGDAMSKHLTDRPHHTCKVIQEKADIKVVPEGLTALGEPSKALYIFKSQPAEGTTKMDVQQVESVASGDVTLVENTATVDTLEEKSEQSVSAAAQDNGSQRERSPERQSEDPLIIL